MIAEAFRYVAIDAGGRKRRGTVHATERQDAFRKVAALGLTPLRVERSVASGPAFSFQRTKSSDIADLSRELAVLVEARIPLAKGLSSIAEHESKPALRDMVRDIATRIESGMALSVALEQYREQFGEVYIETIRAAEKSGNLSVVMAHLADMLDRQIESRQQLKRAMTYPVIVMGVVALAVGVIVVFVVPKFASTFGGQGVQMPLITRIIQSTGEFAKANWAVLLAAGAAAVFGLRAYLRTEGGRVSLEKVLARLPYIGRIIAASTTGQFARVFSIGLSSGLDVIESVEISGRATGRRVFGAECDALAERLRRGEELSEVVRSSAVLPSFAKRMLCAGRDATELSRSCEIVARHYDREAGHLTKNANTVIEPVLTVFLAVIVLGVALSVFLPMWQVIKVNK